MTKKSPYKVAIVGTGEGWREAPYDDPTWEIWACNQFATTLERCDRIFEIHRRWNEDDPQSPDREYLKKLKEIQPPVRVLSIVPIGGPANVLLDRGAMFDRYGAPWFSSSFSYMLAHALDEDVSTIGLWGCDMESREELVPQYFGMLHFIALAEARGIEVRIPDYSILNRVALPYPDRFESTLALFLERKAKSLEKSILKQRMNAEAAKAQGWMVTAWVQAKEEDLSPEELKKQLAQRDKLFGEIERHKEALERLRGALFATQQYKRLFVWNVLPPDIGEETDADVEDCGPI